ncbi:MAG: EpsI family protein [Myxococcales bacterium]|nr:EpsI family protein [Myxococcales bacterium]
MTGANERTDRRQALLLGIVLLAVGSVAWSIQLRAPLEVDATPLDGLPRSIGPWRAIDIPLETGVEAILRADHNVQRVYAHPVGARIGLYVGYYGTERGGRPEHTPWVCYPNAGWSIDDHRTVELPQADGLRVNELEVQKDGNRALVHFWYRSFRSTGLLGGTDQVLDRFVGRLRHARSDGALVRLSTPLEADDDWLAARSRLASFVGPLDALLAEHWPDERPAREH